MTGQPAQPRDQRIDVIRGLALLVIVSDHIRGGAFAAVAPGRFGFSDMAEVFVFVSGIVCGWAYIRKLNRDGLLRCQVQAMHRCCQIYGAFLLGIAGLFAIRLAIEAADSSQPFDAERFWKHISASSVQVVVLQAFTLAIPCGNLSVLQLYIVLVFALPSILWLYRFSESSVAVASTCLYVAAQTCPAVFALPQPWRSTWAFNPVCWQWLFVLGICAGLHPQRLLVSERIKLILGVVSTMAIEAAALCRIFAPHRFEAWADKNTLGPLRVLHFACLTVLVMVVFPRESALWQTPPSRMAAVCGRNSLITFVVGVPLSLLATLLLANREDSLFRQVVAHAVVWGGCWITAWVHDQMRRTSIPRQSS